MNTTFYLQSKKTLKLFKSYLPVIIIVYWNLNLLGLKINDYKSFGMLTQDKCPTVPKILVAYIANSASLHNEQKRISVMVMINMVHTRMKSKHHY